MLTKEQNDLVCRSGPGTPLGELFRQYWLPAFMSDELAEPDGAPLRLRLLGEDLVAWRNTDGSVGVMQNACPHRGASMFFGRNEENGLRCVYHGWKFDTEGQCVDMPNEPAESNFKHKIKAAAYAAADWGGITWVYMGPRQDNPPGVPQFEWGLVPDEQRQHSHKIVYECNWMQALEGELDTTHVYFLHSRLTPEGSAKYGAWVADKAARLQVMDTEAGVLYAGKREEEDGNTYYRTTQFLFPIYGMFPGGDRDGTIPLSIYLPVDDSKNMHWGLRRHPSQTFEGDGRPGPNLLKETGELTAGIGPMKPRQVKNSAS